jgi:hypothetical protein
MLHFNSCFYYDSPRASAMLSPFLVREGLNVRFADGGVSTFENTTINNSYYLKKEKAIL